MASIKIDEPPTGGTVSRPFTANGTYADSTDPTINVTLTNAQGPVAFVSILAEAGAWSVELDPGSAMTGVSLIAEIEGTDARDTHTNITVTNPPPVLTPGTPPGTTL